MHKAFFRSLLLISLFLACTIFVVTYMLFRLTLHPVRNSPMKTALIDDATTILRSSLKRSLIFPALFLTELDELELERLVEKDCQGMQEKHSKEYSAVPESFRPTVTRGERLLMLLTLQMFIKTMEEHGLTYFLYGGTLLGAYRHHGFIPWDDDIDVMVRTSDKARVCQILSNVPGYSCYCPKNFQWKFFRTDLDTLKGNHHRWPYVDIFFFSEKGDVVVEDVPRSGFNFSRQDVFPLRHHTFQEARLPVPQNISGVLEKNYNISSCTGLNFCHKTEKHLPSPPTIPCSQLHGFYPFVNRSFGKDGMVRETLMMGDIVLRTEKLPEVSTNQSSETISSEEPLLSTPAMKKL